MTAIQQALTEAGIKAPSQKERVWRVVKEAGHTGATTREISLRLSNLPKSSVSALLADMSSRGMVGTTSVYDKNSMRNIYRYTTDLDEYKQMPVIVAKAIEVMESATPAPIPAAPTTPSIDHLTITQARELYAVLHKMFGRSA